MRRVLIAIVLAAAMIPACATGASASTRSGSCLQGMLGTTIDCGGGYVIRGPAVPARPPSALTTPRPTSVPAMVPYVSTGPGGRCWAVGPAHPAPDVTVTIWQTSLHLGACVVATPAAKKHHPAPAPADPAELALRYWQVIPLPHAHPSIPPGYAICGKRMYLVTDGTTAPPTYRYQTPLGPLAITAHGAYMVNWGDPVAPGWTGPYPFEGRAWPSGRITHTYDDAGRVSVTIREVWTATWTLGGDGGTLTGLATSESFGYPVYQLQAVVTQG